MDDQRFDDIVKERIRDYEAPGFDPSALSAFHHRMAASGSFPWYVRYKRELAIACGMVLCTLVIVWSQWHFSQQHQNTQLTSQIHVQQEQIEKLLDEVKMLRSQPPDTIRIIESKTSISPPTDSYLLIRRIASLEETLMKLRQALEVYVPNSRGDIITTYTSEATVDTLLAELNRPVSLRSNRLEPKVRERTSMRAYRTNRKEMKGTVEHQLPVRTLREIEKHYHHGIGIRVGPTGEISSGLYDGTTSKIDITTGLLSDFIVSPALSIETGFKFSHRFYEVREKDLADKQLPNVDNALGTLLYADIDSWILDIPVNLKYRYPINLKTNWIAGIGYSSMIYTRQAMEYEYAVEGNQAVRLNASTHTNKIKAYPGTLNFSIGLTHRLKRDRLFETSLFYQKGLGETGLERTMANFFGVRATYWFILK